MRRVQRGPLAGLASLFGLLAGIGATVGLGPAGWLAGTAYGVGLCALLARGLRRQDAAGLGPADVVTLSRAILIGGVTALVADGFTRPTPVPLLVGLTTVALLLDAVDGQVARRTGTESDLGARFDMEVDAYLILLLGVHLAPTTGAWVLVLGAMRYAFVAAGWTSPWLRGTLPPRQWRKVVAALQGIVLAVAAAGVLPPVATSVLLAGAFALLVESFGRDVGWLWQHRPVADRDGATVRRDDPVRVPAHLPA
ncbi:CDP-alcohol phosphatidyltransferase family protein [Micromonospora sp. ATCC 39149]|uniref:CDP-alcohol phosphatidyltransferase family protein n=1 Tax=Micromonospora carbonacea TaxID=47853 RepID=A0A7D6CCX3_9ACTN|nr:CDP-alcohol phosphatidyltransferase family protein [Micromonospora sp. ATCC 39149]QLJ96569.1 CDP-alcohol phosphatidyltransferase family protein [Micromonospora carbonacea]